MFVGVSEIGVGYLVRAAMGAVAVVVGVGVLSSGLGVEAQAGPVSAKVKRACVSDYRRYCRSHLVGSQALRVCMRANGKRLSDRCVNALAGAGQISKKDLELRKASNQ